MLTRKPGLAAGAFTGYAAPMSLVAFDTLKFVQNLEAAGIQRPHAIATAEAVAEGIGTADLATKSDLVILEQRLEKKIDGVKADLAMVRTEIAALDHRMTAGFRDVEQRMTIKLGGMLVVVTGILLAAIRLSGALIPRYSL